MGAGAESIFVGFLGGGIGFSREERKKKSGSRRIVFFFGEEKRRDGLGRVLAWVQRNRERASWAA